MALKTHKRSGEYTVISKHDDALDLPGNEEERLAAWNTACETGNWQPHIKPGGQPVIFKLRPIGAEVYTRWQAWKDEHGNSLADTEYGWSTLGRIALHKIEGSDDLKVVMDEVPPFGVIVSGMTFEPLGHNLSRAIQFELGMAVIHRETVTLGK